MKKFKIIMWIIIVAFIGNVFYHKWEFFSGKQALTFDPYFMAAYNSPDLPIAVWFLAVFGAGLLVAFFFSWLGKLKTNKTIKGLNKQIATQMEMITQLRTELESHLKVNEPSDVATDSVDNASEKSVIPVPSER